MSYFVRAVFLPTEQCLHEKWHAVTNAGMIYIPFTMTSVRIYS